MTVAVQLDLLASVSPPQYPDGIPGPVCDLFETLALSVASRGFPRYSARALLHQIRWHYQIEKGNREFKCNNNWTPAMSRWFIARHPTMSEFFELRESHGKGTSK